MEVDTARPISYRWHLRRTWLNSNALETAADLFPPLPSLVASGIHYHRGFAVADDQAPAYCLLVEKVRIGTLA